MIRAPVAPNGWPSAIEPPITFTRSSSIAPAPLLSSTRNVGEDLRRERFVHFDEVDIREGQARRPRAIGIAYAGR